jgi:hypothetical protein
MSEQPGTDDPADTAPEAGAVVVTRHRDHHFPARGRRITVRLDDNRAGRDRAGRRPGPG